MSSGLGFRKLYSSMVEAYNKVTCREDDGVLYTSTTGLNIFSLLIVLADRVCGASIGGQTMYILVLDDSAAAILYGSGLFSSQLATGCTGWKYPDSNNLI
eukprot:scaffold187034_cov43-Attheya_sp.AAC.1